MKTGDLLIINLSYFKCVDVVGTDIVLPDQTCGQWDSGALIWDADMEREWFLSVTGDVYEHGTENVVGVCHSIAEQYKTEAEAEAESTRVYPFSGVCANCGRNRDDLFSHPDGNMYCSDIGRCEARQEIQAIREEM